MASLTFWNRMPAFPKSLHRQFLLVVGIVLALAGILVGVAFWELDQAHRRMQDLNSRQLSVLRATTRLASLTEAVSTGTADLLLANDAEALITHSEALQRVLTEIELLQPELLQDNTNESILDLQQRSQAYRVVVNTVLQLRQEGFRDAQEFRERLASALARVEASGSVRGAAELARIATIESRAELEAIKKKEPPEVDPVLISSRLRHLARLETRRKYSDELQHLGAEMTELAQDSAAAANVAYDQAIEAHLHASRWSAWKLAGLLGVGLFTALLLIRHLVQQRILNRIDVVSSSLRGKMPAGQTESLPVTGQDEIADMARSVEALMEDRRRLEEAKREMEVAREEAEKANQMKTQFLANISHEIRTPMNAILGYAQILARDQSLSRSQLERISIINRAGEHLLALINDILEMSKIEAGRIVRQDTAFDLYSVLNDIVSIYSGRVRSKGLTLCVEKSPSLPQHVVCDEGKIRQTLVNLLGNAVKFTKEGGVKLIADAMEKEAGSFELKFTVSDTGPGLTAEEIPQLFRPFIQMAAGSSMGGTGLGLAISRQYARLLGGDVTVTSVPGEGASFTFTAVATIARDADVARKHELPPILHLVDGQSARILIVDDDAINRKLMQDLLEPLGFLTRQASNGLEALEALSVWKPDAILMDMHMPVMNGYEAVRRMRDSGETVVIVGLTAAAFDEEKAAVMASGADVFIRKPFKEEELLAFLGKRLNLGYQHAKLSEPVAVDVDYSAISKSQRMELKKACEEADYEQLLKLCDSLASTIDPAVANAVRERVLAFDYEGLASALLMRGRDTLASQPLPAASNGAKSEVISSEENRV